MTIKKGRSNVGADKELELIALVLHENPLLRSRVQVMLREAKRAYQEAQKRGKKASLVD